MTGRVDPPKRMHDYPDRDIDCQQALEREVQELIARAQAAGWTFEDVGPAVGSLLWAHGRAMDEVAVMETQLAFWRASARR
ncbi:hypothetical protein [Mesorhizobium sp. CN2-181]|uniref:hypothetical protein n=1 Tax=Mesorhizobium yinganensis TaxID=3157707 RepID=UPI0032B7FF54